MAVIIGGITPRDTVFDSGLLELDALWGVHALSVGGRNFVYVAGFSDSGISGFEVGPDGSLTSVQNLSDDTELALEGATNFGSAVIHGTTYLYANGSLDDGVSAFRVNANGTLTSIQTVQDSPVLELEGPEGRMSVATVGSTSFLIVSGYIDDGFSVFQINPDGKLQLTDAVTDTSDLELDEAYDTATATVGGGTFVFVAGSADDGLSVFQLAGSGVVTNVQNVVDDATLELDGAFSLSTAVVGGTTFLVAAGNSDQGLSVFSVSDTGQLANVFNLSDTTTRALDGAAGLTTFTLDGETFVAVSVQNEKALAIFYLDRNGHLTDVTTVFDTLETALGYPVYNAFAQVGGTPLLIGSGQADDGLSTFDLGSGNDTLTGTAAADVLLGLAGNDTLNGAGGEDRLLGGTGDDTYLVDSAGDQVVEQTDGGTDTVQAFISITLATNVENLTLTGTAALDGTGNELGNQITGNAGANRLLGRAGRDDLAGGKQADTLLGGKGKDTLAGQGGSDDFVFTSLRDSGTSKATHDVIEDFGGKDDIVLRAIDANKGERGNQAFELDTDGRFDAGEIRFRETRAGVIVEMNVDRDTRAEMSILVRGSGTLDVNDFLF